MDEGEDKVFTAIEVQALLDKQRNKLNERFAALEARFLALMKRMPIPRLLRLLRGRSQTWIKLRWTFHLSLMGLLFMQSHMNIPSNACLCLT
jgi:sugar-specific transcriptional regulator TrmB